MKVYVVMINYNLYDGDLYGMYNDSDLDKVFGTYESAIKYIENGGADHLKVTKDENNDNRWTIDEDDAMENGYINFSGERVWYYIREEDILE